MTICCKLVDRFQSCKYLCLEVFKELRHFTFQMRILTLDMPPGHGMEEIFVNLLFKINQGPRKLGHGCITVFH